MENTLTDYGTRRDGEPTIEELCAPISAKVMPKSSMVGDQNPDAEDRARHRQRQSAAGGLAGKLRKAQRSR